MYGSSVLQRMKDDTGQRAQYLNVSGLANGWPKRSCVRAITSTIRPTRCITGDDDGDLPAVEKLAAETAKRQ